MQNGKELLEFWHKAKHYAATHNLRSHAQDFASYTLVQKLTNPKRSLWLSSLLVDFKRKEFGDLRQEVGRNKKRLARQYYELIIMADKVDSLELAVTNPVESKDKKNERTKYD